MKRMTRTAQLLSATALTVGLLAAPCAFAAETEDKPTANLTVGTFSQYIWRGWELSNDSIVIEPSMTVSYKGVSVNLWGNLDTNLYRQNSDDGTNEWTETDLTLSYDGTVEKIKYGGGYIYYGLDSVTDSQEVYVYFGLATLLNPKLTVCRDIDAMPGWYITAEVSHSLPISGDVTLDLGARAAYHSVDGAGHRSEIKNSAPSTEAYSAFHDGLLSAAVNIPINKYFSVKPALYYSFPLSGEAKDLLEYENSQVNGMEKESSFLFGGVSVSLAF